MWGCNNVCVSVSDGGVFVCRAGAYLLTAAVLAAFSSACCCKTFRLTFHAEIKIAAELERKPVQREEIKAGSVSSALLRGDKIQVALCRSHAGRRSHFFSHEASRGLISTRSFFFVIGMSGEKKNEDYK